MRTTRPAAVTHRASPTLVADARSPAHEFARVSTHKKIPQSGLDESRTAGASIKRSVKRVLVTGPAGAGKSELANELGKLIGIPVVHLDKLFWGPGWVPTPPHEWEAVQRRELAADSWIADAQFDDMLPDWLQAADTVVFVDTSMLRCLWRVSRRRVNRHSSVGTPADTAPSSAHRALLKFLRNQWRYRRTVRRRLLAELARERDGMRVVVLRRGGDADAFLRGVDSPGQGGGTL
jgi:adenylate kinase family enzyme